LLKVLYLLKQGAWGKLLLGKEKSGEGEEWVRSGRSTLVLFRQNIVRELNIYTEAAKQLIICSQC